MKAEPMQNRSLSSLRIQPATLTDADLLWRWANDPEVRLQSLHPEPIALETHLLWYAAKLQSPQTRIWLIRSGDEPVAQIRYDVSAPSVAEIDYAVAPAYRGQGIGTWGLVATCKMACQALDVTWVRGIVRLSNPASARAFEKAGFRQIGPVTLHGFDCVIYERMCPTSA